MADDGRLMQLVKDELHQHPGLDASAIAVGARAGRVILRGTVGSVAERAGAGKAPQKVFGVVALDNRLEVAVLNARGRGDAELRARVLEAIMLAGAVPETVDVEVADRFVTLTGTAKWQYQRDEAAASAVQIVSARALANEIQLVSAASPDGADVKESIVRALGRDRVGVSTSAGKVTLTGVVPSWSEHDAAIAAARATPGVNELEDRISVAQ
jgi:osmotically-inducible protein OsmY